MKFLDHKFEAAKLGQNVNMEFKRILHNKLFFILNCLILFYSAIILKGKGTLAKDL